MSDIIVRRLAELELRDVGLLERLVERLAAGGDDEWPLRHDLYISAIRAAEQRGDKDSARALAREHCDLFRARAESFSKSKSTTNAAPDRG